VPPDVTGSVVIGGPAVAVSTTQPGQNGMLTFSGTASQRVTVHAIGNTTQGVAVTLLGPHGRVLASTTSGAGSFNLATVMLPSTGVYTVSVDPAGMNVGTLNIALTNPGKR